MTIKGLTAKIIEKGSKIAQIDVEGQIISVPSEHLPIEAKSNDLVKIHFFEESNSSAQEKKLAKSILEEILNGN